MNDQLKIKVKTLPPEVYAYLDSFKSDELNVLIIDKYKFNLPQLRAYYDLIAQLFLKEIPVPNLVEEIKHIFGFAELVARQLACDIAGVRLLVVVEWLGADIAGLISAWGGDPSKYQNYTEIQRQAIPREARWIAEQLAEPSEPLAESEEDENIDWGEREKKIKEFFTDDIVEMLRLDDDDIILEINEFIFYLILNVREAIKDELVSILLNNQEVLTSQRIVLEGKQVEATVANWLNCFIKQKGSALFDAVTLSDFITNSPNAKFLDFDEKKLLSNLLSVYRNLKFFPESLPSPDPKYWMIFPVDTTEEPINKTAFTGEAVDLTKVLPSVSAFQTKVFAKITHTTAEEEAKKIETNKQITETEALLARYSEGSLERLALEEELNKLKVGR